MKKKINWFPFFLAVFCFGLGLVCFGIALTQWMKGKASAADTRAGFTVVGICFFLGAFFSFFARSVDISAVFRQIRNSNADLNDKIDDRHETVTLAGIVLSPEGFSYRRFLKRVFVPYTDVTQIRSRFFHLFINGIRANSIYSVFLTTPRGKRTLSVRYSRIFRFQKAAKAVLFVEKKVTNLILARELEKYKRDQVLDFGCLSLQKDELSFGEEGLSLKDIGSYGVSERWISLFTKLTGKKKRVDFKRGKIWNEEVLFGILEEKLNRSSRF